MNQDEEVKKQLEELFKQISLKNTLLMYFDRLKYDDVFIPIEFISPNSGTLLPEVETTQEIYETEP